LAASGLSPPSPRSCYAVAIKAALDDARERRIEPRTGLAEIAVLKATAEELAKERDASANRAQRTASLLKDSEQHWGHDMADVRTQQSVFLKERLGPLLNDAVDALEINPPEPQIAMKRLKSALASIQEALK